MPSPPDPNPRRTADLLPLLSPRSLRALLRIAKDERRGARPFFEKPRDMIALREAAAKEGRNYEH